MPDVPGLPAEIEHAAALLKTLAYPPAGADPKKSCPPAVSNLEFAYPTLFGEGHVTFRLEWTNGLVMEGALNDVRLYNPRTD